MIGKNDETTMFSSEEGDVLTLKQIGRAKRHEPSKVESTEDGYIINGTEYTRK